ncbi:MAG: 3-deoxy-7-phosphoheptulonate synthase [Thermoplasmata archaeon]
MIFILETSQIPEFRESISLSTCSYRKIDLYDREVYFTWGGELEIEDKDIIRIPSDGRLVLSSRSWKEEDTVVDVSGVKIGGKDIVVAAGPCSVESEDQLEETAKEVKRAGASMLRGGVFKPRTSPYSFQGLGMKGLEMLIETGQEMGMPIVTEILDIEAARNHGNKIDMIQVGSRNGQNYPLLRYLGTSGKPVLLKNGMGNTVDEWLSSSEYILSNGNGNVVICYRGVRSFESGTRFSMDIGSIANVKMHSHLPVAADPSHPAGKRKYVENLALGALAAGADMLEIEVHANPETALSDKDQQLHPNEFASLMNKVRKLSEALGRGVWKN